MRRFYSPPETFANDRVTLGADEARHMRDVLRLRAGDVVRIFDGFGREFDARIESIAKREAILDICQETSPASPESPLELTLAAALMKGEKFDLVVQKAVELGVARLAPIVTKRTDVRLHDESRRLDRWRRVVLEASKQCGRARLMEIDAPRTFAELLAADDGPLVLFSERGGAAIETILPTQKITAIVGSEGGWEDSELELAEDRGVAIVTFGGRILRAETAAIAVAVLMQHKFGDLK